MIAKKLQNLSLVGLSALNGFALVSIIFIPLALFCLFDSCKAGCQSIGEGFINVGCFCDQIRWVYSLEVAFIIILAGCLVRFTFARRIKSTLLVWQLIGFVTVILLRLHGSIISFAKEYWYQCFLSDSDIQLCHNVTLISHLEPRSEDLTVLPIILIVILAFNFLFSLLIRQFIKKLP